VLCVPVQGLAAQDPSVRQQLASLLAGDGSNVNITMSGKTLHGTRIIRDLYKANDSQSLWSDDAIAALSVAIDSLQEDGMPPAEYRFEQIDSQLRAPAVGTLASAQAAEIDILMTEAFLRAVYNLYFGKADPERLDPNINFARSYEGEDLVPFLLERITQVRIDEVFDWARPHNRVYKRLKIGLARYRAYQAAGGWAPVPDGGTLKPGDRDPRILAVRTRLVVTEDLPADKAAGDDPQLFDDALESAVRRFQQRHGIDLDGAIGPQTLKAMNVPVQDRIDEIRVNLERARWILHQAYDEFMVTDIAGFEAFWVKDGEIIWREPIQVGRDFTQTPVFIDEIQYLEFNPTWTIPPGILRRSVIPGLKKDPAYLDKKGYQLLTLQGKPVDPKTVDWATLKGFPYIVRQPPGPNNALGLLKFMFPNPHFVYLHDTNARGLFDRSKRTFSSGCVRVRNPMDLADRLLAGQQGWTREKIDAVIASGKTTRVNLDRRLRILIAYNTARFPIDDSQMHFRPDVYDRDAKVLAALNGPFVLRQRDANRKAKP